MIIERAHEKKDGTRFVQVWTLPGCAPRGADRLREQPVGSRGLLRRVSSGGGLRHGQVCVRERGRAAGRQTDKQRDSEADRPTEGKTG